MGKIESPGFPGSKIQWPGHEFSMAQLRITNRRPCQEPWSHNWFTADRLTINTADRADPRASSIIYQPIREAPEEIHDLRTVSCYISQSRARGGSLIATISPPESTLSKPNWFSSRKKFRCSTTIVRRVKFHKGNPDIIRNGTKKTSGFGCEEILGNFRKD